MVKIEIICSKCQRVMKKVNVNHHHNRIEVQVECTHCGLKASPPDPTVAIPSLFG